ncbi:MAG: right-handed parallel beta-helix repeat-containing protein [Planctomycetes bacterium]|nr:right-handed parallel beta-helix repeat-containing protein [Planctomycetota bacterium]
MGIQRVTLLLCLCGVSECLGAVLEIQPTVAQEDEEFERRADAVIRNNVIFDCTISGITAAPHAAVPHMRNVRIVNNTLVNHPVGVRIRWDKATDMVFANNAVFCPESTALDVSGVDAHKFSANYLSGRLVGASIDGSRFAEGGNLAEAFAAPAEHNYLPKPDSALVGRADPDLAPPQDFSGTARQLPFDLGAYEVPGKTPAKSPR